MSGRKLNGVELGLYTIRELTHFEANSTLVTLPRLLQQLTESPALSPEAVRVLLADQLRSSRCLIVEEASTGAAVGYAQLMLRRTLTHGGAVAAHVEDVVVDKAHRGQGLGIALTKALVTAARESGAYKVVLVCAPRLEGLYGKAGFKKDGIYMKAKL